MKTAEKWNRIVEQYNKNINVAEEIVQNIWEQIFVEMFGYSRFAGEIESQRSSRIGSTERVTADIIIKNEQTDLFVVELKRHDQPLNIGIEQQLISYLKLLRNSTGILICDKIYVYAYDYSKDDDEQNKVEIEFTQDHPDGIKFVEMFSKGKFDEQAVRAFVRQKIEFANNVTRIQQDLTSELIDGLLRDYFTAKYGAAEFEQAISGYDIMLTPKGAASEKHLETSVSPLSQSENLNYRNTVDKQFILKGVACSKNEFEEYLRTQELCHVNVTLFFQDKQEHKIWQARNFSINSNLSGNLASGFLRNWKAKGIVGIKLEM